MKLLPLKPTAWTFSLFYKKTSLLELVNAIEEVINIRDDVQKQELEMNNNKIQP